MPKRDSGLLLEDMLAAVRKIERYTAGMTEDSFLQDEKTLDAVARNLEILGEAAKQLPEDFLAQHPGGLRPGSAYLTRHSFHRPVTYLFFMGFQRRTDPRLSPEVHLAPAMVS